MKRLAPLLALGVAGMALSGCSAPRIATSAFSQIGPAPSASATTVTIAPDASAPTSTSPAPGLHLTGCKVTHVDLIPDTGGRNGGVSAYVASPTCGLHALDTSLYGKVEVGHTYDFHVDEDMDMVDAVVAR